jgi:hypothetical protein
MILHKPVSATLEVASKPHNAAAAASLRKNTENHSTFQLSDAQTSRRGTLNSKSDAHKTMSQAAEPP